MTSTPLKKSNPVREYKRYSYPPELVATCEGKPGNLPLAGPTISVQGMFINTPAVLPEGAVVKLTFRLIRINVKVSVRAEVRYRIPGIGVGVEFIDLEDQ